MLKKKFIMFLVTVLASALLLATLVPPCFSFQEIDLSNRFYLVQSQKVLVITGDNPVPEDLKAAQLVADSLKEKGNSSVEIVSVSQVNKEEIETNNLVLIGGPLSNFWYYRLQSHFSSWLTYYKDKWTFAISGVLIQHLNSGFIDLEVNPYNSNKFVFIVAGMTRNGTLAAGTAFAESDLLANKITIVNFVEGGYKEVMCLPWLDETVRERLQLTLPVMGSLSRTVFVLTNFKLIG